MKSKRHRFFALIIVGIVLSSLYACSPPAYDIDIIEKIGLNQNIIYVRASKDCSYCDNVLDPIYFSSADNGQTWKEIASPTNEVMQILNNDKNTQAPICLSADTQICYRITDKEWIEVSSDGGITWQIDWQIPQGRKYYMQRHASYYPPPDTIPFDMQIVESSTGHFVVVVMGNQGVLVKTPDGEWNRYAVGKASPTPYQSASFAEATSVLFNEQIVAILIALVFFLFLSVCVWVSAYMNSDLLLSRRVFYACLPFILSVLTFIFYYLITVLFQFRPRIFSDMQGFVMVLPLIGFAITWLAIILVSRNKGFVFLALICGVIFSIALYLCIFFPFQLWAVGTINVYENAKVLVWLVGAIICLLSVLAEVRVAVLAVKQIDH